MLRNMLLTPAVCMLHCARPRHGRLCGSAQITVASACILNRRRRGSANANKGQNINPITSFLVFICILAGIGASYLVSLYLALVFFAAGAVIAASLKMANVWQKFVVLRMGKLQSVGDAASRSPRGADRGRDGSAVFDACMTA